MDKTDLFSLAGIAAGLAFGLRLIFEAICL